MNCSHKPSLGQITNSESLISSFKFQVSSSSTAGRPFRTDAPSSDHPTFPLICFFASVILFRDGRVPRRRVTYCRTGANKSPPSLAEKRIGRPHHRIGCRRAGNLHLVLATSVCDHFNLLRGFRRLLPHEMGAAALGKHQGKTVSSPRFHLASTHDSQSGRLRRPSPAVSPVADSVYLVSRYANRGKSGDGHFRKRRSVRMLLAGGAL